MPMIDSAGSALLAIDFQARLMPVIADADMVLGNARRLIEAAHILGVPAVFTEQNPNRLGATVPELWSDRAGVTRTSKMCFDAGRAHSFAEALPEDRPALVVMGCEAHVCVLQTVLGLLEAGRRVHVVQDAIGSRRLENKHAAIARMERHGADIVTTEMVVFEWLGSAEHPRFRDVMALIK